MDVVLKLIVAKKTCQRPFTIILSVSTLEPDNNRDYIDSVFNNQVALIFKNIDNLVGNFRKYLHNLITYFESYTQQTILSIMSKQGDFVPNGKNKKIIRHFGIKTNNLKIHY